MTKPHYISNAWHPASGGGAIPVIDPSTGETFGELARGTEADIASAVAAARAAIGESFDGPWGRMSAALRGRLMLKLSAAVTERNEELALLEARDCGKPMKTARVDVTACARYFEFYGGACDKLHGETHSVHDRLHGAHAGASRTASPATSSRGTTRCRSSAAGSAARSPRATPASSSRPRTRACRCCASPSSRREIGFPAGALNIVTGLGARSRRARWRRIPASTTSRSPARPAPGALVAQAAAKRHCPVTLELGGKSPQIVFADADLDAALPVIVNAIVQNAGQTCSAGSRLLVRAHRVRGGARRARARRFARSRAGPPASSSNAGRWSPQAARARARLPATRRRANGIPVAAHGVIRPDAPSDGYYQAADAAARRARMTRALAREEVFGPVLAAMPFDDEADAIAARQRHRLRSRRRRLDARRRAAAAHGARSCARPGVRQQLRRGRRRRAAVRRREATRATAARRASRRCTVSRRSRPSCSSTGDFGRSIVEFGHVEATCPCRRDPRRVGLAGTGPTSPAPADPGRPLAHQSRRRSAAVARRPVGGLHRLHHRRREGQARHQHLDGPVGRRASRYSSPRRPTASRLPAGAPTASTCRSSPRAARRTRRSEARRSGCCRGRAARRSKLTDVKGGVAEFAWSPDSTRLAFVASDDDPDAEPEKKEGWKRKTDPADRDRPVPASRRTATGTSRTSTAHRHLRPRDHAPRPRSRRAAWTMGARRGRRTARAIAFLSKRAPCRPGPHLERRPVGDRGARPAPNRCG